MSGGRVRARAVGAVLCTALVAACGGGGPGAPGPAAAQGDSGNPLTAADLPPIPSFPAGTPPPGIEDFVIQGYTLVSSARISRSVYEDTYAARVRNSTDSDATVTAALASNAGNVTVVDGELSFGTVRSGAIEESTDTFTIRHDRSLPFNEGDLLWLVQGTALSPTTFALIDQAVTNGGLDPETALLYKVYYEFGDDRLPAQYLGRDDGFFEGRALDEARKQLSSLSPATQAALAPFFLRPDEPGSWNELPSAGTVATQSTAGRVTTQALPSTLPGAVCGGSGIYWCRIKVTVNGTDKAWIWWMQDRRPQDESRAALFKGELQSHLWNPVLLESITNTFGEPLRDDLIPGANPGPNPGPHGPDGLMDIYLTGSGIGGRAMTLPAIFNSTCDGTGRPAVILLTPGSNFAELAHELTHAIVIGYKTKTCIDDYHWMNEATATWAQYFAYPGDAHAPEHRAAAIFLNHPDLSLDFDEPYGFHQYGAYLWFFRQSGQNIDPAPVLATWRAAQGQDALDAIVAPLHGGLDEQWPLFLASDWNQVAGIEQPYRDYYKWDNLNYGAHEFSGGIQRLKLPNFGAFVLPLHHDLPHLAAEYHHLLIAHDTPTAEEERIRQVWVMNKYAGGSHPEVGVYAIAKIRGQDWKQIVEVKDPKKLYCRDKPDEDIQELVVIISNRDPHFAGNVGGPGTKDASDVEVRASPLPCHDWVATVNYRALDMSENGDSTTVTSRATGIQFKIDAGNSDDTHSLYTAAPGGVALWHVTDVSAGCSTADVDGAFAALGELYVTLGGPSLTYILTDKSTGSTAEVVKSCPGGPTPYTYQSPTWLPAPSVFGTLTPVGGKPPDSFTDNRPYGNEPGDGWTWTFTRAP